MKSDQMRNKTVYILWIVQPWSPIFLFSTARVKIKLRELEGHISFKLKLKRHLLFLSFKKKKKKDNILIKQSCLNFIEKESLNYKLVLAQLQP